MRAIDADALLKKVEGILPWAPYPSKYAQGIRYCMELTTVLIKDAPTIEPEPHWIPCSEKLPEDDVQVLCTDSEGFVYIAWHCDYDVIEKTKCWCDVHYCSLPEDGIIAWMPLPEPYREGHDENSIH